MIINAHINNGHSHGFRKLLYKVIELDKESVLLNKSDNISYTLNTIVDCFNDIEYSMKSFDILVGRYINRIGNWEGKVVQENFPPNLVLDYIHERKIRIDRKYDNLYKVYIQRRNLSNVLKRLNKEERNRGRFWENFSPYARRVQMKEIGNKIAIAFVFKEITFVEYAPKGNSGMIYKTLIFNEIIEQLPDWRVRSKGFRVKWLTMEDGSFWHRFGWEFKLKRYLKEIIRREETDEKI